MTVTRYVACAFVSYINYRAQTLVFGVASLGCVDTHLDGGAQMRLHALNHQTPNRHATARVHTTAAAKTSLPITAHGHLSSPVRMVPSEPKVKCCEPTSARGIRPKGGECECRMVFVAFLDSDIVVTRAPTLWGARRHVQRAARRVHAAVRAGLCSQRQRCS